MRLGLDFDNTIVNSDAAFFRAARARGWVTLSCPATRLGVRTALRARPDGNVQWTELQGEVYGARLLEEGTTFAGWEAFWQWAEAAAIARVIISHKTLVPALGPPYPLREVALQWLARQTWWQAGGGAACTPVHFAATLGEKIARIAAAQCDVFIDDHLDVLMHPAWPAGAARVWYGHADAPCAGVMACPDWASVHAYLMERR